MEITQSYLKSIVHYDPDTGVFTRRITNTRWVNVGDVVGSIDGDGYWRTRIKGKDYKMHRLAFVYMTGSSPEYQVDHINGNKTDNRWENLRAVTAAQNRRNTKRRITNTSGVTGVFWGLRRRKWLVYISASTKRIYLGAFTNKDEAIRVRKQAENLYGYHENHGRAS
jgi:HNH endonuclease